MINKKIDLLNLEQLKYFQINKNDADQMFRTFYLEHSEEIANTYFYHKGIGVYCKFCPLKGEVLQGGLQYTGYFIGQNFQTYLPSVYERSGSFKIESLNFDEIEILTKEEFVAGLKEQLQDALDKM